MVLRIKNVDIVTIDEENRVIEKSNIYIEDGMITHMGDEIVGLEVEDTIDGSNKAALPGIFSWRKWEKVPRNQE